MPDLYSQIADAPATVQEMLGDALEVRASDPQMREMQERYFGWLDLPERARAIELGCGAGHVLAHLVGTTAVTEAVGLDPSPVLVERAKASFGAIDGIDFMVGDARDVPLEDATFDLVLFHTTLSHVPGAEHALAEASRLLRPGGTLAAFDGEYAAATVAVGPNDPLQDCLEYATHNLVNDVWLCRSLPERLSDLGFDVLRCDLHPYIAQGSADYFLTILNRGADFMAADRIIAEATAGALKGEAAHRIAEGSFFGSIPYMSVIARKP